MRTRGRESTACGMVKIRQVWTRRGIPLHSITIPTKVMEHLDWHGGQYLTYYPTTAGELVLLTQESILQHIAPDLDPAALPEKQPKIGMRPGSIAAIALKNDYEMKKLAGDDVSELEDQLEAIAIEERRMARNREAEEAEEDAEDLVERKLGRDIDADEEREIERETAERIAEIEKKVRDGYYEGREADEKRAAKTAAKKKEKAARIKAERIKTQKKK